MKKKTYGGTLQGTKRHENSQQPVPHPPLLPSPSKPQPLNPDLLPSPFRPDED